MEYSLNYFNINMSTTQQVGEVQYVGDSLLWNEEVVDGLIDIPDWDAAMNCSPFGLYRNNFYMEGK